MERVRDAYGSYHEVVAAMPTARFWRFMNYGYVDLPTATGTAPRRRSVIDLPARMPARNAARLVAEVVGDEPLEGRVVLDVGCGRGGAARLLATAFGARPVVAVDLVRGAAVAADGADPAVHAAVADAQRLPLATGALDAVLNVESSLHYPDLPRFFVEVARVLRHGGAFLYTDLHWVDAGDAYDRALAAAGLALEVDDDITANVLASRQEAADREARALAEGGPTGAAAADAARFTGVTGTDFTAGLAAGAWRYRLLRLRRTDQPAAARPDPRFADAARAAHEALGHLDQRSS